MKKLILLILINSVLSMFFFSCKSNMSIAKRRYNNGYYIAHNKGKHTQVHQEEEKTAVQSQLPKKNYTQTGLYKANNNSEVTILATANNHNEELHKKTFFRNILKKQKIKKSKPLLYIKHALPGIARVDSDVRDGLSLLWIVILVILIVWAIGLLAGGFGLGGLINILLAVALVLLILWLLKIL